MCEGVTSIVIKTLSEFFGGKAIILWKAMREPDHRRGEGSPYFSASTGNIESHQFFYLSAVVIFDREYAEIRHFIPQIKPRAEEGPNREALWHDDQARGSWHAIHNRY